MIGQGCYFIVNLFGFERWGWLSDGLCIVLTRSGVRFVRILSGHAALHMLRGLYSGTLLRNFVIEAYVEVSDLVLRRHAWPVRFG